MAKLEFTRNDRPTLGVELELQLIDAESMALKNCIDDVLAALPENAKETAKHELMQSYLEINTGVCENVAAAGEDLRGSLVHVASAAEACGAKLGWAATHPFSPWMEQRVTPKPRYLKLVETLRETARRLVSFGLHVHVGVESGDKAVMICDRIARHLPTILAMSVNSPFWQGRDTGLHSQRTKVMEGLPTAGLPPQMRNWSEYTWLINHLIETGFIETIREIWWDVRPHHNFGTVEVRVCDMPADLDAVLGLTAVIQCLVVALSREIDEGTYQFDSHPMMVRQNKWRACRYGLNAQLVDPYTFKATPARQVAESLITLLEPTAQELGCADELKLAKELLSRPTGAELQRRRFEQTRDLQEVTRVTIHD